MGYYLTDIGNLLIVLSALGLSLIVPPLIAAVRLCDKEGWPAIFLTAFVLGLSTQGVLGFFWDHYLRAGIHLETTVYLLGWLIISLVISAPKINKKVISEGFSPSPQTFLLIVLLILSITVRSIYPVRHMALGQSDAYSHLQFLRDVLDYGFVQNVMYPPGYHWILALPTAAFQLDPYLVARFGGAFFGASLVLAVYVLVKSIGSSSAALISAFLVSCFPGFHPLLKTGVGTFANQLGIFFIPAAFYFYVSSEGRTIREARTAYILLALSLLGLSVSVPMMLIHVLLILFAIRLSLCLTEQRQRLFRTVVLLCAVLPAVLLLGLHLSHAGPVHQQRTIEMMTERTSMGVALPLSEKATNTGSSQPIDFAGVITLVSSHPLALLAFDFFSVKRLGVDSSAVNFLGFMLLAIFVICFWCGFAGRRTGWMMIGIWGITAAVQTLTGFLQFSGYQREGWSLLIGTVCLSGIVAGAIYHWGRKWFAFRAVALSLIAGSIVLSIVYPPRHDIRASCAEDEIIRVVRDISRGHSERRYLSMPDRPIAGKNLQGFLSPSFPLSIVTRKITGWPDSNQGEIVPNVIHTQEKLQVITVSSDRELNFIKTEHQYLVLMDRKTEGCSRDSVLFSMIAPGQLNTYIDSREANYKINESLQSYLNRLDKNDWQLQKSVISQNLIVIGVTPRKSAS